MSQTGAHGRFAGVRSRRHCRIGSSTLAAPAASLTTSRVLPGDRFNQAQLQGALSSLTTLDVEIRHRDPADDQTQR